MKDKTGQGPLLVCCAFQEGRTKVSWEGETEKEQREGRQDGGRAEDRRVKIKEGEEQSHAGRAQRGEKGTGKKRKHPHGKVSFPPGKKSLTRAEREQMPRWETSGEKKRHQE